jgi:TRAP-type mannitol/chloroaromatic compound transport system permease small subunit
MNVFVRLSILIDKVNDRIGKSVYFCILASVVISALNALMRKLFSFSSNSLLEVQWYLYSAAFLLGAGYALQYDEHVRVDVITERLSRRARAYIEIFGTIFILFPLSTVIILTSWSFFSVPLSTGEMSPEPGGLILWPARALIPFGFILLMAQGLSQLIKSIMIIHDGTSAPLKSE